MSDLIDRQAAIELIERMKPYHQEADDIAEMIANMPSAQPELTQNLHNACTDLISRQEVIKLLDEAWVDGHEYQGWLHDEVNRLPSAQPEPLKITIDHTPTADEMERIKQAMRITPVIVFPSAYPEPSEITDEQAIMHLQSTGWMQNHDREMYESGLRERLADDSDSYDALLPSAQPEIVYCKYCICGHGEVWLSGNGSADFYGYCGRTQLRVLPYDYCSYAKRRTDESD